MNNVTIAQISDLHIGQELEKTFDVEVRSNFSKALAAIKREKIDYLVITGDLCYRDGDEQVYRWIKLQLEETGLKYFVLPGNHDEVATFAKVFNFESREDGELYYVEYLKGIKTLFLDTSKGYVSPTQLNWLKKEWRNGEKNLLVFMHHPPVTADAYFMDTRYPLQNKAEVHKILLERKGKITVFCGHYHAEKTVLNGDLLVCLTPSTFFQIDQEAAEFKVDHHLVAWRKIVVEGEEIRTTVKYVIG